eukprot:2378821-Rhodomonas_salina.5
MPGEGGGKAGNKGETDHASAEVSEDAVAEVIALHDEDLGLRTRARCQPPTTDKKRGKRLWRWGTHAVVGCELARGADDEARDRSHHAAEETADSLRAIDLREAVCQALVAVLVADRRVVGHVGRDLQAAFDEEDRRADDRAAEACDRGRRDLQREVARGCATVVAEHLLHGGIAPDADRVHEELVSDIVKGENQMAARSNLNTPRLRAGCRDTK